MDVIFSGNDVRVVYYRNTSSTLFVTFSSWEISGHPTKSSSFRDFGSDILYKMGYSQINVQTNKNNWYQTLEMERAIVEINKIGNEYSKIITYGSSMGGYACINFSSFLKADCFLSISPQFSMDKRYKPDSDTRWDFESRSLEFVCDYIHSGDNMNSKGWILYDNNHMDRIHAEKIGELTKANLVGISGSGHPCGGVVNRSYGLKRVLKEISDGVFVADDGFYKIVKKEVESSIEYLFDRIDESNNKSIILDSIRSGMLTIPQEIRLLRKAGKSKNKDVARALLKETSLRSPKSRSKRNHLHLARAECMSSLGMNKRAIYELLMSPDVDVNKIRSIMSKISDPNIRECLLSRINNNIIL